MLIKKKKTFFISLEKGIPPCTNRNVVTFIAITFVTAVLVMYIVMTEVAGGGYCTLRVPLYHTRAVSVAIIYYETPLHS